MKVARLAPATFVYVQGLSLANPVYLIFLTLFIDKCGRPLFRPGQLAVLLALLMCQFLAFSATPHALPMSAIATVMGLLAFAARPEVLFDWRGTDVMRRAFRRVLIWVLLLYVVDSLMRVQFLHLNWVGWSDYELKEWIKSRSWLADDTNTLAIRVIFLYFIARSVGLLASRPWWLRALFLYLVLSSYSRAGLAALLLVLLFEVASAHGLLRKRYVVPAVLLAMLGIAGVMLRVGITMDVDSSVISKIDLVVGSINHWWSVGWWERLVGAGYYSNIDVGTINWAAGHSIVYYALVDFGVLGTLLLGALLLRCATTAQARWVLLIYGVLGLSVFRFDFLFLYVTLFFVEHVSPGHSRS